MGGKEVIEEIVLPMTTKYLYFDENPVSPIRWLDGYYQLVAQIQEERVATDVSKTPTFSNVESLPSDTHVVAQAPPPPTSQKPVATDNSSKSSKLTKKQGGASTSRTSSARSIKTPSVMKCTGDLACRQPPTYARLGAKFPDRCKTHKMPDMIVKATLQPSKESAEKLPISPNKALVSFKAGPCEDVLEGSAQPLAVSKTKSVPLKDLFKVPGESSPPPKQKFCCKTRGCTKIATYAHFDEPDDLPVMCEHHAAGLVGCYKAAALPKPM